MDGSPQGVPRPVPARSLDALEASVSVWSYANVLLRRPRLLVALPLVFALLGIAVSLLVPRKYIAFASFVPQEPATLPSGLSQLASQFGLLGSARPGTSSPQFYADLLISRDVLRDVVTTDYATPEPGRFQGSLYEYFKVASADSVRAFTAVVPKLLGALSIRADKATGIVRLEVSTKFPELSRQVARKFLDEVNAYNQRRRHSIGRAEREFLETQEAEARQALKDAEDELATFFLHNRRFQDSPELVAAVARLQRQVSMRQQLYVALNENLGAAKIEEARNTPVITEVESPEGLIQRQSRGTVRNSVLGFFLGLALAVGIAFFSEYAALQREEESRDYEEFLRLRRQALGRFGRMILRQDR